MTATAPSPRTEVRRAPARASYDRELAYAVLDEGKVAHVGIATERGPVVIPMAYGRDGDRLLLHGSPASRLVRTAKSGVEVCVTVTILDGLVLARSTFHHSMNYRSVVVFGTAEVVEEPAAKCAALDRLVEHLTPGRSAVARPPTDKELRATTVLALALDELSMKARTGGPIDDDDDLRLDVWAGVVPLRLVEGEPVPDVTPSHDS